MKTVLDPIYSTFVVFVCHSFKGSIRFSYICIFCSLGSSRVPSGFPTFVAFVLRKSSEPLLFLNVYKSNTSGVFLRTYFKR
jgi:hypothetical protein